MKKINKKNNGFTLIELIVVVAIIAVLATIAVPAYNHIIDNIQEKLCISEMNQIQRLFYMRILQFPGETLGDVLQGNFSDEMAHNIVNYECPSGGEYYIDSEGYLSCTIHGRLGSIADANPALYLPGTDLKIYDNYWPQPEDFEYSWSTVPVAAGGVFEYEGEFYVLTEDIMLTLNQAESGPGGDAYNWYSTQKLTGNVLEFPEGTTQISGVQRGDIVKIGDQEYVIFDDGGEWAYDPDYEGNQWYVIPND